jgi:lipid-A-disaccharide synthase
MGLPFVMVYRVSPLTYALGKPRVKVAHYAMVNLIAGKEVVPELVQKKFTASNVVAELEKIIPDGEPRTHMIQQLAEVRGKLKQSSGSAPPAEQAAGIVLELLQERAPVAGSGARSQG